MQIRIRLSHEVPKECLHNIVLFREMERYDGTSDSPSLLGELLPLPDLVCSALESSLLGLPFVCPFGESADPGAAGASCLELKYACDIGIAYT